MNSILSMFGIATYKILDIPLIKTVGKVNKNYKVLVGIKEDWDATHDEVFFQGKLNLKEKSVKFSTKGTPCYMIVDLDGKVILDKKDCFIKQTRPTMFPPKVGFIK